MQTRHENRSLAVAKGGFLERSTHKNKASAGQLLIFKQALKAFAIVMAFAKNSYRLERFDAYGTSASKSRASCKISCSTSSETSAFLTKVIPATCLRPLN